MTIATNLAATAGRPASPSSSLFVAEIDESFRLHQNPAYWRWLELSQADHSASIVHHPDYLFHDLKALGELSERSAFFLAESAAGLGAWAAGLVPKTLKLTRFAGCGSLPVIRGYRLVGDRPFGAGSPESMGAFFGEIERFLIHRTADFLLIEDLVTPSLLADVLQARSGEHYRAVPLLRNSPRYGIRLTGDPDDYWRSFSKNARKQNRKILADTQPFRLWRVTDVADVAEFLRAAETVATNSWQQRRLRDRIVCDEVLLERLTFLAQNGALRSYVLFDGDRPIAFELDTQFNSEMTSETAAYDADYARVGPGRALLLRVLEDLFAFDTPSLYDFGSGDWEYKKRFSNDCRMSSKICLLRRSLRFDIYASLIDCEHRLRSAARAVVNRFRKKS